MTDIDQLSGLELRKALCRALGWQLFTDSTGRTYAKSPESFLMGGSLFGPQDLVGLDVIAFGYPALESDPGVFWPEFERWGNTQCVSAEIETGGSVHVVVLTAHNPENDDEKIIGTGRGVTLLEAGCRAWLKTLKEAQ